MSSFVRSLCSVALAAALIVAAVAPPARAATGHARLPRPAHVVVVVEENHTFAQVMTSGEASFMTGAMRSAALFTDAHGVTHPSLPNYLALFSGRTNDNGDDCPATGISAHAPNLGSELLAAHLSFAGYSESLPSTGSTVCAAGTYARKHAPWVAFDNIPSSANRPLDALRSYDALPTLAFLVPNVDDDMHDGSVAQGDAWFKQHLASLLTWANAHDTLVVLTWDEGYDATNSVPTAFFGPMVKPGRYSERIDHLSVLRTLEDLYGLPHAGASGSARAIVDVWR